MNKYIDVKHQIVVSDMKKIKQNKSTKNGHERPL